MRRLRETVNRAAALVVVNAAMLVGIIALFRNDNSLCRVVWYLGIAMIPVVVYQSARWQHSSLNYVQLSGNALISPDIRARRINRVRLYALRLMIAMLLQACLCSVAAVLVIWSSGKSVSGVVAASFLVFWLLLAALIALARASQCGNCMRGCERLLDTITGAGGRYLRAVYEAWSLSVFSEGGDSNDRE